MRKVAFYTLGCKVNQYETEAMSELFEESGYEITEFHLPADIYIINTCTVTNMGDRKSRQIIRRAKKTNPDAVVAVTGCYAQTAPEEVRAIEGVNLVIGTKDRGKIVSLIEQLSQTSDLCQVHDIMATHEFEELHIHRYTDRTRAYIKIQEGCNQFCSYCIIPYARGPVRSRKEDDILTEIKTLAENGFHEVILVGIHVASYGFDLEGTSLSALLNKVNQIEGISRIRLSSIEPMTLNDAFVDSIKDCNKLCHHFHLSLQAGADETLRRMNRKYTTAQYKGIVERLRFHFPDVAVTTDIMVGFPGETEDEFSQTADFVRSISFADAHIFQYSPRKGTPAAKRADQVSPETKEQRSKIISQITADSRAEFLNRFLGQKMQVLFERAHKKQGWYEGKTGNYITVIVPSGTDISGTFQTVQLDKTDGAVIEGTLCSG